MRIIDSRCIKKYVLIPMLPLPKKYSYQFQQQLHQQEDPFPNLKLPTIILPSCICQERLVLLSVMLIENEVVKSINFDDLINKFVKNSARKSCDQSRYHINKVLIFILL